MRIALITGASSGLGRQLALAMDKEGVDEIWAIARSSEKLCSLAMECETKVRPIPLDLRTESAFLELEKLLSEASPEISWLICSAGYGRFGETEKIPPTDSDGMIGLNCTALVRTTLLALGYMKRGGRIIEVASLSAYSPLPYMNVYAASKSFVLSFSRSLGYELRPRGITVCALCPGWIDTNFVSNAKKTSSDGVTSFPGMKTPDRVAASAVRDARRGRKVSTPGAVALLVRLFGRLFPTGVRMLAWDRIRK